MGPLIAVRAAAVAFLLAIAGLAFAVSYQAIHDVWIQIGAGRPEAAWMVPLIIDGAIVVASLTALARWLDGERPVYPWVIVGAATVVSVACNVAHAEDRLGAQALAAVIPLALLAAAELVIRDGGRALSRWAARRAAAKAAPSDGRQVALIDPENLERTAEFVPAIPTSHREVSPPAPSVVIHNDIHNLTASRADAATLTTPPHHEETAGEVAGEVAETGEDLTTRTGETTPPARPTTPPRREVTAPPLPPYSSVAEAYEEIVVRGGGRLGWRRAVTLTGVSEYRAKTELRRLTNLTTGRT